MREFGKQDGSLQRVKSPIHTEKRVMMPLQTTMCPNCSHLFSQAVVAGEQCAAIAVTSQRFRREKAGAANQRHSTAPCAILRRSEALSAILNHRYSVLLANFIDPTVI